MRNSVAIMNTKGGVGKSTIVLALAETLSAEHGKNVLVIDSDAQATVSSMLMTVNDLFRLQNEGLTLVDFLVATILRETPAEWSDFVVRNVSDVDDARSVYLVPSDMQLTLFEREVSKVALHSNLRKTIAATLDKVRGVFDVVLIDCPPGLSILTECWLREADFHISPTKADYVSVCGLEVFRRFKALNPEMGFAENLGVLVNMRDAASPTDEEYVKWLRANPDNRTFDAMIPRVNALQDAARFHPQFRSYGAKYPGQVGHTIRALANELLQRIGEAERRPAPPRPTSALAAATDAKPA
ncbi:MAG: ParA family protein [Hyphomicrobiaceae bacterium]|nr:ParA family protein [Hyphomicrobiaceae bacterium]